MNTLPFQRVADMVREMFQPGQRGPQLTKEEEALGSHLRGNAPLYEALKGLINSRLEGMANVPEPTDPNACKSLLARDRELRVLLRVLERIYYSPVASGTAEEEQPA